MRAGLRGRFAASPLGDAAGLARAMEAAFRGLWTEWCVAHARGVAAFGVADAAGGAVLMQAMSRRGMDAAFWSDFGVVLRAAGRIGEAEAAYRRALEIAPDHAEAAGQSWQCAAGIVGFWARR